MGMTVPSRNECRSAGSAQMSYKHCPTHRCSIIVGREPYRERAIVDIGGRARADEPMVDIGSRRQRRRA